MARWLDEAFSGPVLFQAHLWSQHRRCTQVACVHPRGCGTQAMGYQQLCSLITPTKAVGGLPLWGLGPLLAEGVTSSLRVEGKDFHSTGEETQCQRDSESHPRRWRPPSARGFWLPVPSSLCSSGVLDIRTAGARWEKQGSHSPWRESLTLEFYIGRICLAKFGKRRE